MKLSPYNAERNFATSLSYPEPFAFCGLGMLILILQNSAQYYSISTAVEYVVKPPSLTTFKTLGTRPANSSR